MVMHTRSTWTTETGFPDFRLGAPLENRMRLLGIASLRAPPSRWIYLSGIEVHWCGGSMPYNCSVGRVFSEVGCALPT